MDPRVGPLNPLFLFPLSFRQSTPPRVDWLSRKHISRGHAVVGGRRGVTSNRSGAGMVAMCSGSDSFGPDAEPGMDARVGALGTEDSEGAGGSESEVDSLTRAQGWDGRPAGRGRSRPLSSPNPITDWLRQRPMSMRQYLKYLVDSDLSLRESLGEIYSTRRSDHRLALALFIDFAHQQRLSPGELAPLMGDTQRDLIDAVCYVIGSAVAEANDDGGFGGLDESTPDPVADAA